MFRSMIISACLIGVVLGLAQTAIQSLGVTPILLAAEQYEGPEPQPAAHEHSHDTSAPVAHHHDSESWAPEDGAERLFYTTVSNIFAGIGFSAILLVVMNQLRERRGLSLTPVRGLLIGGICYLVVFVAPSLGLPPEVPGSAVAPLETRQLWWLLTVLAAACGLCLLFLAPLKLKVAGAVLCVLPYLFVPAQPEGPLFANPDPDAVAALTELHHQFIWASGLTNLAFWLLAGLLCALVVNRFIDKGTVSDDAATA